MNDISSLDFEPALARCAVCNRPAPVREDGLPDPLPRRWMPAPEHIEADKYEWSDEKIVCPRCQGVPERRAWRAELAAVSARLDRLDELDEGAEPTAVEVEQQARAVEYLGVWPADPDGDNPVAVAA